MSRLIKKLLDFKKFKEDKSWWWLEVGWEIDNILTYRIPFKWIRNLKWWILYRTTQKYHLVNTKLEPGYYDKDWLMLNACFSLLVDFVEREAAWMKLVCSNEEQIKVPWYMTNTQYVRRHSEELGIAYLKSSMELCMELDDNGCMTKGDLQILHERTQGWCAQEMLSLYLWWKYERDIERKDLEFGKIMLLDDKDNNQLIRLMKIRESLWT